MSYFISTDIIYSLLDPRLVDPGSTLINVGANDPCWKCRLRIEEVCNHKLPYQSEDWISQQSEILQIL